MAARSMPITTEAPAGVAELLADVAAHRSEGWDELVRRYGRWVQTVIRGYRLQDADARDAEQRTWLRLLESHHRIRDPEHLGSWLATTARRECLSILRERRSLCELPDLDLADPCDVEQHVLDAETTARIWAQVELLPERPRAIAHALLGENRRPYTEVAAALGIPVGSLGPTRARIIRRLRRMFDGDPIIFGSATP